jgi:hypothetical protein
MWFVGDASVERSLRSLGVETLVLASKPDLGPRLAGRSRRWLVSTPGTGRW